ncbi:MAG TPA: YceD family protein [Gammaproteobacteria bacterium]|nr:YceD family protein [Gammaproteobacteria bacterium]
MDNLPLKVDPFRFSDNSLSLEGKLLIKDMPRLFPSLSSDEGEVVVNLKFGVDEEGIRNVKGHMETCLILQCQRCLESFKYEIIGDFMLAIVRTEKEAERLPERYDPLLVPDLSLILSDMVEDELIINLPIVPMHKIDNCKVKQSLESYSNDAVTEKESPFKNLESLRSKRDSK